MLAFEIGVTREKRRLGPWVVFLGEIEGMLAWMDICILVLYDVIVIEETGDSVLSCLFIA